MGELTFLFTDVEGSTRLLRESQSRYIELLASHREALRSACRANGGVEVDTQGDAFFFTFEVAQDAVSAAADAQRALANEPIRIRMGIHTGNAERTGESFVGLDVHQGARIAAAAHGGQVVLSRDVREQLHDGVALLDLGEHRLKDFDEPVWLYQLGREAFPSLRTISNTNLPRPASSFVGREVEVRDVVALLRGGARLLTLTGPGGSGKTRLSLEAAAELLPAFRSGVFWVGLAPVREPRLVTETIARTLGAREELAAHIGERELLIVLDNVEQVVDAAPELAALVERCANLRLLVTSREVLRVRGEVEFPVPPLAEPEAVALFSARAGVAGDAEVAALCVALDNLPLAVELAAARVRVLSPAQIRKRLSQRLDLLKGGRDSDPRHQTLRATIAWSYDLLSAEEAALFRRLAVFGGGFTLAAAESVCDADLDVLQALVEKSLVRQSDKRFWMLETIREYALERLDQEDAARSRRHRHAQYFLELVERAEPELMGADQADMLERVERDLPNIRVALAWFETTDAWKDGLRIVVALRPFWYKRGYLVEGRRWLTRFLDAETEATPARVKALATASLVAALQGDWLEAKRWGEEGRSLGRTLRETKYECWAALTLGRALGALGEPAAAVELFEQVGRLARETDDRDSIAMAAFNLGYAALDAGDVSSALREFQTAAAAADDPYTVARVQAALGSVALHDGRAADAATHLRASLRVSSKLRTYDDTVAWALELLGAALCEPDAEAAALLLGAAEALREELGLRLQGIELDLHERATVTLRETIGDEALAATWASGRALSREQAVAEALS